MSLERLFCVQSFLIVIYVYVYLFRVYVCVCVSFEGVWDTPFRHVLYTSSHAVWDAFVGGVDAMACA